MAQYEYIASANMTTFRDGSNIIIHTYILHRAYSLETYNRCCRVFDGSWTSLGPSASPSPTAGAAAPAEAAAAEAPLAAPVGQVLHYTDILCCNVLYYTFTLLHCTILTIIYYKVLFRFADAKDLGLMALGAFAVAVSGANQPLQVGDRSKPLHLSYHIWYVYMYIYIYICTVYIYIYIYTYIQYIYIYIYVLTGFKAYKKGVFFTLDFTGSFLKKWIFIFVFWIFTF